MLTADGGVPTMGYWEKGKLLRELTKDDIEFLEQQQLYGQEEEEGEDEEEDDEAEEIIAA